MPTRQPAGRAGAQWTDFASLERELRAFVAARPRVRGGRSSVLPSQAELLAAGRPDLAGAIALHGSHRPVAAGLGLAIPAYAGTRKPYRY